MYYPFTKFKIVHFQCGNYESRDISKTLAMFEATFSGTPPILSEWIPSAISVVIYPVISFRISRFFSEFSSEAPLGFIYSRDLSGFLLTINLLIFANSLRNFIGNSTVNSLGKVLLEFLEAFIVKFLGMFFVKFLR